MDMTNEVYQGNICLPRKETPDIIFGYIYSTAILLIHIYLLFTWISHRHTFQVRQRSPYLVCLAILANAYVMLLVPFTLLFASHKYNPNQYINSISQHDSNYQMLRFLRSLYTIGQSVVWTILVDRNIRIFIVLKTKIENQIVRMFFKYENFLFITMIFVLPLLALHRMKNDLCQKIAFFGNSGEGCQQGDGSYLYYYYWNVIHTFQNIIIPISFFINLNIPSKFTLNVENCVCFFTYQVISVVLMIQPNRENQDCIFFLQGIYFFADLRNIINILLIVMYPIYESNFHKFHYLPSSKQKNNYVVFLLEKQLYDIFSNFIEFKRKQYVKTKLQNLEWYKYSQVYLNYYQLMQIILTQTDAIKREQNKQQLIKLILTNQEAYAQDNIDYLIHKLQQCNNAHLDPLILNDMHNTSLLYIEKYFEDYMKTNSYKIHVTKILENNDYLNQRLIEFDMESTY